MPRPRLLVLPPPSLAAELLAPPVRELLDSFADWHENPQPRDLTPSELAALAPAFDGLLTSWGSPPVTLELLRRAPRLRIVAHAGGTVRSLVGPEVLRVGLVVTNAASAIAPYVAEVALGLTLAALRRLADSHLAVREGRWDKLQFQGRSRSLFGATVGLVGFGHIARSFARLLLPFGCRLLAYDPHCPPQAVPPDLPVALVSLDRLLAASRVISLHAPDLPATRGLIGARELALMPDGAVLVNTARGALLDHDALLAQVRSGRLLAALDVTDPEPLPPDHPLRTAPGAIIVPHIAGRVHDQTWRVALTAAANLAAFFAGQPPPDLVTPDMLGTMG